MKSENTFSVNDTDSGIEPRETDAPERRRYWFAAGGMLGAILASSCCIVPLVLASIGVSGAWIGNLTALEPYRPYFAAVAAIIIGLGFRHVYLKPKPACEEGSYCARSQSSFIAKSALWIAAALVLLAITVGWWAPLFY